ncbi:MAG: hypothetical protein Q8S96_11870 [Hydrogenophaga sp.]|uniref:hypothetical protein n=1 Tax=Hydrogenophaga sp. TaxID=1904254 RepID=UPI002732CD9B|nr:hypothetical protein [Hydrogenophaga sp.]MDP3345138.1 hypothetical protein [Hydrogenophaga sp.]MDP3806051.1 hypothetical protein [Hydrogenophaga sp.]
MDSINRVDNGVIHLLVIDAQAVHANTRRSWRTVTAQPAGDNRRNFTLAISWHS